MTQPENPPAFAAAAGGENQCCQPGMSLRDWFAGQALVGLMSNSVHDHCPLFGDDA